MRVGVLIVGLVLSMTAFGQKYSFDVKVDGAGDSTIYLVRYTGEKLYYADTAVADKSGKVSFDTKFITTPGMYAVMPGTGNGFFQILLNNEDVDIETGFGAGKYVSEMNVITSQENKVFYEYVDFIQSKSAQLQQLQAQQKAAKDEKQKEAINEKLAKLNEEVVEKQRQIIAENEGTLVAALLAGNIDVEVPDAPTDEEGNVLDDKFQRNYYVSHFWDNMDLTNNAYTRMPVYEQKLKRYFTKVLPQQPDSLIEGAKRLTSKLVEGSEMYKFTVVWITSHYQKSKIMCMDKVFVHMVLAHYKTGKAFWMSEEKNKEIVERAEEMAPVTCGEMAHNISLPDTTMENWIRLHSLDFENTVLIFWDPDCGHCKKEVPKLIKMYKKWKSDGLDVEVYSVSSKNNQEWIDFIDKHDLTWLNVAVPTEVYESQEYVNEVVRSGKTDLPSLNYHQTFDVYKTPTVFLLDDKKVIVGKGLDHEGLDKVLRDLQKKNAEE